MKMIHFVWFRISCSYWIYSFFSSFFFYISNLLSCMYMPV